MAGSKYVDRAEKERILNKIQTQLNEWKELVVLLHAIILWEKKWFPALTVTCVTILYLYAWLMSGCSTLCTIWTVGLYVTLLDCFVCGPLFQKALPSNSWTEDKERAYTTMADTVADCCATFGLFAGRFLEFRRTRNMLFHAVLAASFITLLYVGSKINTLFKSYVTVLVIILYPGFKMRTEYIGDNLRIYLPF